MTTALPKFLTARRQSDNSITEVLLRKVPGLSTAESVFSSLDLSSQQPKMGDEFAYYFRVTDRKGQITASKEFKLHFQDDWHAFDKEQQRYKEEKQKTAEKLRELTEKHRRVRR